VIVKKVPISKKAAPKSKAHNVRALVDYIAGPDAGRDGEKIEHRGALNLLAIDHEGQVQEMIDLAEIARRSPQPVQHWIMSWREGERPTAAQADEAVGIFLKEMGLADHQVVYAIHRDTKNCHLHLAVNRVHPETEKVITVNNGFDHEVAHRAIARIELQQGWRREERGLYVSREGGEFERAHPREERERQPSTPARDFEERSGLRSAQRIAIEVAAPIIRAAPTWIALHDGLARQGIRFERKGSGAILWIGEEPVKASSAGRDCSMAALQKRLGHLKPNLTVPPERAPQRAREPLEPGSACWRQYEKERDQHVAERRVWREGVVERQWAEWRDLLEHQRAERAEILSGSWRGRGDLLNATRSVLAADHARVKAELREVQRRERQVARQHERFPPFRDWLRERGREELDRWRGRDRKPPSIEGPTFSAPEPKDIRAFTATIDGPQVHYYLAGGPKAPAFTDRGKAIDIHRGHDRATVLAALQLGAQKWGSLTVQGGESFKQLCVELAREHGFKLANPELQRALGVERAPAEGRALSFESQRRRGPDLGR
jgi:hypothetical protein